MKDKNYIRSIFDKYVKGESSSEELDNLFRYFGEGSEQQLHEIIDEELQKPQDHSATTPLEQQALDRIDRQVYAHLASVPQNPEQNVVRRLRRNYVYRWAVAVAVLLICTWGAYSIYMGGLAKTEPNRAAQILHDQDPGGNRATLTLADGRILLLRDNAEGIVVDTDEITYGDGLMITGLHSDMAEKLNSIQTPRAGQYRIILPDGTKVWLNAESSLRYPGRFVGSERRVELEGEAYFEVVSKAGQKFKVVSKGQEVEVLGTQFNINAYANEPHVQTTLVEGAVRVTAADIRETVELIPGQKSKLGKDGLQVGQTDVEVSIAWKDNDFMFKDQDLRTTMRQLARWYDVEVSYAPDAPMYLKLGGSVSRNNRLSSVLHAMASTNKVAFDFDGKTIKVKSPI